jgi:hypothetical protein
MQEVYRFPNGFRREAEAMFKWLAYERLQPAWGNVHQGKGDLTILIPDEMVPQLRLFQRTNPARWGNPPKD